MNDTTIETTDAPAPHPLPGGVDPRVALARALETAAVAIAEVRPDQAELPTSTDMTVAEMVIHLMEGAQRAAHAAKGTDPRQWPTPPAVEPEQWEATFRALIEPATTAWADDALLERPTVLSWATLAGSDVVAMYAGELTAHTWDLARGAALEPAWDPEVVAVSDAIMHALLPDADRQPMWDEVQAQLPEGFPWADPFVNAVDVPGDAPAIDRYVAWTGRRP